MYTGVRVITEIKYVQGPRVFLLENPEGLHGRGSSFDWDLKDGVTFLPARSYRSTKREECHRQGPDATRGRIYLRDN